MRTSCYRFARPLALAALWLAVLPMVPVQAQSAAAQAQALYNQRVAACDTGQPRPAYNGCVRAAGLALDRSGTLSSGGSSAESVDGRSTIFQPPGAAIQNVAPSTVVPETTTSDDGRATLLVPSDSTLRGGATR
ncbi:MAG: hypothetical protein V4505_19925 [Pseudomonadota bacterium]